jgi:hypothetical protein
MHIAKLVIVMMVVFFVRPGWASIVTYSFQGTVSGQSLGGNPYGLSIPNGTGVTGQFVYDTDSAGVLAAANATKYLQHQPDGFITKFASNEFRASDYLVTVSDNAAPPQDQFAISFRSDALLSSYSLYVNNVAQPAGVGQVVVILPFANTEWSGTSLLTSLDPSHLTPITGGSILGAPSPTFVLPKIFFTIQSVSFVSSVETVPEPSTGLMATAALAGALVCLRISGRRGR